MQNCTLYQSGSLIMLKFMTQDVHHGGQISDETVHDYRVLTP